MNETETNQLDIMLIGSQLIEAIQERIKASLDDHTELYFKIDDLYEEFMELCEDEDTLVYEEDDESGVEALAFGYPIGRVDD